MPRTRSSTLHSQSGAITLLVALMLLVLLTIAAVGMSRNSFREVVISGTTRQGALVRNAADTGVEWSICWLALDNASKATANSPLALITLKNTLLLNDPMSGKPYNVNDGSFFTGTPSISSIAADQKPPTAAGTTLGYTMALTRMGKLPITDMSQGITQGTFAPATGAVSKQAPDLWAVRSDAQLEAGTGLFAPVFIHAKEGWISTPVQ
jgi:Tfp pilus assembly protein PilX